MADKPARITEENVEAEAQMQAEEQIVEEQTEETPVESKSSAKRKASQSNGEAKAGNGEMQSNNGAVSEVIDYNAKAKKMKEALWKQELVSFMIPLKDNEDPNSTETVILNGYRLNIKKGVFVKIPLQIAELLADSYKLTLEAGKEYEIGRKQDVEAALA